MFLICDYRGTIAEICDRAIWIKHQKNGVDILCNENEANAVYSNDTDSFYPAGRPLVSANKYHIVEVESVPEEVTALDYKYVNGEFVKMVETDRYDPEVRQLKTEKTANQNANDTTDLQLALVDAYEKNVDMDQQVTDLQLTLVDMYEATIAAQ